MPNIPVKRILLHPATLFVGCVVLIVAGTVILWEQNSQHFLESKRFSLTPDRIVVNQAPGMLSDQLKTQIVEELVGSNANTLDTQLVGHVASLVESMPHVKSSFVKKTASSLTVDVDFRRPVAVVELNGLPIATDGEGVLLDGRIYRMESPDELLRVSVDRPVNEGLNSWQVWPDQRIVRAAKICSDLEEVWREFGIYRVVTYWAPGQKASQFDVFELWTKYGDGGKVIWSNAVPTRGDATTEQKIALIRQFIANNGPLSKLAGLNKLDVRTGQIQLVKDSRTAARRNLLNSNEWSERTVHAARLMLFGRKFDR